MNKTHPFYHNQFIDDKGADKKAVHSNQEFAK